MNNLFSVIGLTPSPEKYRKKAERGASNVYRVSRDYNAADDLAQKAEDPNAKPKLAKKAPKLRKEADRLEKHVQQHGKVVEYYENIADLYEQANKAKKPKLAEKLRGKAEKLRGKAEKLEAKLAPSGEGWSKFWSKGSIGDKLNKNPTINGGLKGLVFTNDGIDSATRGFNRISGATEDATQAFVTRLKISGIGTALRTAAEHANPFRTAKGPQRLIADLALNATTSVGSAFAKGKLSARAAEEGALSGGQIITEALINAPLTLAKQGVFELARFIK